MITFTLLLSSLCLIAGLERGLNSTDILMLKVLIGTGVSILVFIFLIYAIMYFIYNFVNGSKKIKAFNKDYLRDIPKEYTPAMASLLYDLKIDIYKDYTATILHLYVQKYIDLENENDEYKIIVKNNDLSLLEEHQIYVFNCITGKLKFDELEFKKILVQDAQKANLFTDKPQNKLPKIILCVLIALVLIFISYFINKILFYVMFSIATLVVLGYATIQHMLVEYNLKWDVNTLYYRTPKGKEFANECASLKQFIKDYTLIKEKNIEYVKVLEEYIPYALALDEADSIEYFVSINENYRNLIYNRK